jgi:hypothetical protein
MRDLLSDYAAEISKHREWLRGQSGNRLKKWNDQLCQSPESAICEAMVRSFLNTERVHVMSNEDPSVGGPDFLCSVNGQEFFVEVTCMTLCKVTEHSGLSDKPVGVSGEELLTVDSAFCLLTGEFLGELRNKTVQCSGLKLACLVAMATLHRQGGQLCFGDDAAEDLLTGTPEIGMKYSLRTGEAIGDFYESVSLRDSSFIRFEKGQSGKVESARDPISGVLLCSFGYRSPCIVGALHPNPNRRFDRNLLPSVRFAKLADGCLNERSTTVEWI